MKHLPAQKMQVIRPYYRGGLRAFVISLAILFVLAPRIARGGWIYGYSVIDLGDLGGPYSQPRSVNNAGQVTGDSLTATGETHAFLYSSGVMTDLGTLGGPFSFAHGINDSGQIAGYADTASNELHAFIYMDGIMNDLGVLPGNNMSAAYAINSAGAVVGESRREAMLYSSGRMSGLSRRAARFAYGINGLNEVVGMLQNNHAFLFRHAHMIDLGALDGQDFSYALGINDNGDVVGASLAAGGNVHAFLYSNSAMMDLGTLYGESSAAIAINRYGVIVGESDSAAFIYKDGVMTNLNSLIPAASGVHLHTAFSVNDSRQIACHGSYRSGVTHAFLLTPNN
jgi:probable HAF family extracellular repeat protein